MGQRFGLAHVEAFLDDAFRRSRRIGHADQCARMARRQLTLGDIGCTSARQFVSRIIVGDMAAALATILAISFLSTFEFVGERMIACAFPSVEVFALDVFDIAISSASLSLTSTGTIGTSCRPAICDARQRRLAGDDLKRSCTPLTGRTTIGWITPCCLIESASSPSSASANSAARIARIGFEEFDSAPCAACAAAPDARPRRRHLRSDLQDRGHSRNALRGHRQLLGFTRITPELESLRFVGS